MKFALRKGWGRTKPPFGTPLDRHHPLAQGLVGYWAVNEDGGVKLYDLSGRNNHADFVSAPDWTASYGGPGLRCYDTGDKYPKVPHVAGNGLDITANGFTLASSFKIVTQNARNPIFSKGSAGGAGYYFDVTSDPLARYLSGGGTSITPTYTAPVNRDLTMVVAVNRADVGRMFANGVEIAATAAQVSPTATSNALELGSRFIGTADFTSDNTFYWWAIWNRALIPSEIVKLTHDPYCFFQTPRRRLIAAATASTVQQDSDLRWNLLAAIQQDRTLQWNLIAAVQQDRALQWNLIAAITKDETLQWNMIAAAAKDSDLRWDMAGQTTKDSDLRWNLLASLTKDEDLRWSLLNAAQKDSDLRWALLAAAQKDSDLRWNLIAAVLKDDDLRWHLMTAVQKDDDLRWNLLVSLLKDADLRWNAVAGVANSYQLVWNVGDGVVINLNVYLVPAGNNTYVVKSGENIFRVAP